MERARPAGQRETIGQRRIREAQEQADDRSKIMPRDHVDLPSDHAWFTSGEVSFLAQISMRMVHYYFDRGRLGGWRVGNRRRMSRDRLIDFMRKQGIPLNITVLAVPRMMTHTKAPTDWPTYRYDGPTNRHC